MPLLRFMLPRVEQTAEEEGISTERVVFKFGQPFRDPKLGWQREMMNSQQTGGSFGLHRIFWFWGSWVALVVKNPPASAGDIRDIGSIPGSGRSPRGGYGNPIQYSCLENPMDRGVWRAAVQRVAKSWTWLKRLSTQADRWFGKGQWGVSRMGALMLSGQFLCLIWRHKTEPPCRFSTVYELVFSTYDQKSWDSEALPDSPPSPALPSSRGSELWTEVWDKNTLSLHFLEIEQSACLLKISQLDLLFVQKVLVHNELDHLIEHGVILQA